jgi:predicted ATP-dependent endonuclease of OLD family
VRLDNFLSFRGTAVIEKIAPISVFVGPNNFGKTNLIRSLRFYQDLATNSKQQEYVDTDKIMKLKHRLTTNDPLSIEIKYGYENNNRSPVPLELVHQISFNSTGDFDGETFLLKRPGNKSSDEIEIFKVVKDNVNYIAKLRDSESINKFLSNFEIPGGRIQERHNLRANKPFGWDWAKSDNPGLQIYGELEEAIERWVFIPASRTSMEAQKFLRSQLGKDVKKTVSLLDQISNLTGTIELNFDELDGKEQVFVKDIPSELDGFSLDRFGSGYEQILILLPQLFQGYINDTIFFIDEPEVHLHAQFQRRLLQYLIHRAENNQFFLTTHSTIFCRQPDDLIRPYLVKKENAQTRIEIVEKEKMENIKSILGHVNADLYWYNAVLFVEGYAEEIALPMLSENMGIKLVDSGIGILNSEGYGNMVQLKNILSFLQSSGILVYAMCDPHQNQQGNIEDFKNGIDMNNLVELKLDFEASVLLPELVFSGTQHDVYLEY